MSNLSVRGNALGTGTVIVESPNTNTNRTITLPDATTTLVGTDATQTLTNKTINGGVLTLMTAKDYNWNGLSTNTFLDFTGIPSWTKRITVLVADLSTNGTSPIIIQIGDSGGIEVTGYNGSGATVGTSTVSGSQYGGSGYFLTNGSVANYLSNGAYQIANLSGNTWVAWGSSGLGNTPGVMFTGGSKTLSATLDRIRVTTVNGTDTFDLGTVNVMYEG